VPEKSRPVATSPAWGSNEMSVTIIEIGPFGSQAYMALPSGDSLSPCQITPIRRFCASNGLGRWRTTMSSRTAWSGERFASSFIWPARHFS